MKVKVCGLCHEDDIRMLNEIRPDYAGFIFHEASPRNAFQLNPDLLSGIGKNILKTGVFVNAAKDFILRMRDRYKLDAVQLHGDESAEFCSSLDGAFEIIIKAFRIDSDFAFHTRMNPYTDCVTHFLLDTAGKFPGGNGAKFDWDLLSEYQVNKPFFLSGGIEPEDASTLIGLDHRWLYACDINSRFEISAGRKNMLLVQQFVQSIQQKKHVIQRY